MSAAAFNWTIYVLSTGLFRAQQEFVKLNFGYIPDYGQEVCKVSRGKVSR